MGGDVREGACVAVVVRKVDGGFGLYEIRYARCCDGRWLGWRKGIML